MAVRYTKAQKASKLFNEYKKERRRIQSFVSSAKRRGITFTKDILPPIPKTITPASVRRLQRITPEHGYYEHARLQQVDVESGRIVFKRGSQTAITRGIAEIKKETESGARYFSFTSKEAIDALNEWRYELEAKRKYEPIEYEDTETESAKEEYVNEWQSEEPEDYSYEEPEDYSYEEPEDYNYADTHHIDREEQLDRVNDYIDHFIDYVGHNVSRRWADAISDVIDNLKEQYGHNRFAHLLNDPAFWDKLAEVVAQYYKSNRKADPRPRTMNIIQQKLTGRPMDMNESMQYDRESEEFDSEDEY